jgi:hypothetical protein
MIEATSSAAATAPVSFSDAAAYDAPPVQHARTSTSTLAQAAHVAGHPTGQHPASARGAGLGRRGRTPRHGVRQCGRVAVHALSQLVLNAEASNSDVTMWHGAAAQARAGQFAATTGRVAPRFVATAPWAITLGYCLQYGGRGTTPRPFGTPVVACDCYAIGGGVAGRGAQHHADILLCIFQVHCFDVERTDVDKS